MKAATGANSRPAARQQWIEPPDGWFSFGSHVGCPWIPLEFSEETDEGGNPLFERPTPPAGAATEHLCSAAGDAQLAERVEARLDAETHDDLCGCATFPGSCATYGDRIPWSHSDVERVVLTTLAVLVEAEQTTA